MSLPALVLVHGGGLAADSWDPTIEQIERLAPELTVLAIDLPGRRNKPGDLRTATIADFVDSVIADIDDADVGDIVGATTIDTVPFKRVARRGVRRNRPSVTPKWLVRFAYLNGVPASDASWRANFTRNRLPSCRRKCPGAEYRSMSRAPGSSPCAIAR